MEVDLAGLRRFFKLGIGVSGAALVSCPGTPAQLLVIDPSAFGLEKAGDLRIYELVGALTGGRMGAFKYEPLGGVYLVWINGPAGELPICGHTPLQPEVVERMLADEHRA